MKHTILALVLAVLAPFALAEDDEDAIHQLMSGYYEAFAHDPAVASKFFGEPMLLVLPNQVQVLGTSAEIEGFLSKTWRNLKPLDVPGRSHKPLVR